MFDECIEFAYITGKEIILTGDFNIDELARNKKKHCSSRSLKNMHFDQLVKEVTKPISRTCLGHIYANKSQHIVNVLVPGHAISDHLPSLAVRRYFKRSNKSPSHKTIHYRDIKKTDGCAFRSSFANSPWDATLLIDDVGDTLAAWENIFLQAVHLHAPLYEAPCVNVLFG